MSPSDPGACAHSCRACDRLESCSAVFSTIARRPMWHTPPGLRLAEGGGALPKPEARRGASRPWSKRGAAPLGTRCPGRKAKGGRRRFTTHVSSLEAEHFCELATRNVPALHSQRPPCSANLSVAHARHSTGKSCSSRARPASVFSAQTQSKFDDNVKWPGHGTQACVFEIDFLDVPLRHCRHTFPSR